MAAVALRSPPTRIPLVVGEDLDRAVQGIGTSAQRLIEYEDAESITTWRSVAMSADLSHRLADQILRQLVKRLIELNYHHAAGPVSEAAHHLRTATDHWHRIGAGLRELTTANRPPFSERSADANDLVVRLGRMLHTDPSWTPSLRSGTTIRAPSTLAPNVATASALTLAVMRTMDAFRIAADRHPAGIEATLRTGRLWAPLPSPRHQPEVYGPVKSRETGALLRHYQRAHVGDKRAILALGQAMLALNRGHGRPALTNQATLIMRRAEAHPTPAPAALADTAFPIPIGEAITAPAGQASARPPTPTALPARTRT